MYHGKGKERKCLLVDMQSLLVAGTIKIKGRRKGGLNMGVWMSLLDTAKQTICETVSAAISTKASMNKMATTGLVLIVLCVIQSGDGGVIVYREES